MRMIAEDEARRGEGESNLSKRQRDPSAAMEGPIIDKIGFPRSDSMARELERF